MINIFSDFRRLVLAALDDLATQGGVPRGLDLSRVAVEPPRDRVHGDLATNAAMVLAGAMPAYLDLATNPTMAAAGMVETPSMALAERIGAALVGRELATGDYRGSGFTVAPAKPGFINIRLAPEVWHAQLRAILRAGTAFGDLAIGGGERVNVEFVSANPTGPMHVGHGRGAVVGDALAGLLAKAGFEVQREYYINDAGAQVDILARSAYLRYREALGEAIGPIPEGFYPGEYLVEAGRALTERDGRKWLSRPEEEWLGPIRDFAPRQSIACTRAHLAPLCVHAARS